LKRFSQTTQGDRERAKSPDLSFPKSKRLLKNEQFRAVLAKNLCISNGLLTLYMAANECGHPRLGISISKAVGRAVLRNRLKRLLREVFRQNQHQIPAGFDYLVIIQRIAIKSNESAGPKKASLPIFEQLSVSFLDLVARLKRKIS